MRIDDKVDERRDPMASTRAAARLLKENYRILGSWPLAITAYNHGTEGIFRAIDSVGSRDLVELIRRYQSPTFGFASKHFYAELLAVVEIAAEPESHFPFLRLHQPIPLRAVEIKKATPVDAVLKPAAISPGDFYQWNPALEAGAKVIPTGYRVNLPAKKIQPFLLAQSRVQATPIKPNAGIARIARAKAGVGQRTPSSKSAANNGSVKDALAAVSAAPKARTEAEAVNYLAARQSLNVAAR